MKRIIFTLTLLTAATFGFAQTPVTNGSFETWANPTGPNGSYEDLPGPFLKTLNSLYDLPAVIGGPGPITTTKVSDPCDGTFGALMTSKSFQGIFIPGAMGTFDVSLAPPGAKLGKPYTDKPLKVKYCAKYAPVAGDSAEVFCLLTKWNGTSRDTIAYGNIKHLSAVASYTNFEFPLTYNSQVTPDTCTLLCVASAGYDFGTLTNSAGQVNSALTVDNLRFDFTTAIDENAAKPEVKMFPSPVADVLNITLEKGQLSTTYRIIDLAGRTVLNGSINGTTSAVNVSTLAQGTYWVQVANAKGIITTKQIHKQ
ncbi:MAG: T9SS type A sorting domain-containing protein [Sphingobacteriales bacterium JAD_PAG50586_3]|nr:MAG: T9SS type A sorting domain-containing protein [Sphingobacteriales bacterium JAD_PAG50586_3]